MARLLASSARGLLVVGELASPADAAAVVRIARLLGWPVVADVLSGLRVGAVEQAWQPRGGEASDSSTSSISNSTSNSTSSSSSTSNTSHSASTAETYSSEVIVDSSSSSQSGVCVIDHMDHLLLGDKGWWGNLKPEVVLQIGPHLTSKRLSQFLEWAAADHEVANPAAGTLGGAGNGKDTPETSSSVELPSTATKWMYVAPHTLRHDAGHLLTHRCDD